MTTPNEELQARLMAAWKDGRIVDMPKPGEPGKRVVGYVIEWDESFPMLPGAIIAALAGHPAPPSAGEGDADEWETTFGWLVENGKQGDALRYRTIEQGIPTWTDDHGIALRFARREDAERFASEDDAAWRIAEHGWSKRKRLATPTPQAAPASPQAKRPVAWLVNADTEDWITRDEDEANANRADGLNVRPLVFGDLPAPASPQGVSDAVVERATRAFHDAQNEWTDAIGRGETEDDMDSFAMRCALNAAQAAIVIPVEPTEAMVDAFHAGGGLHGYRDTVKCGLRAVLAQLKRYTAAGAAPEGWQAKAHELLDRLAKASPPNVLHQQLTILGDMAALLRCMYPQQPGAQHGQECHHADTRTGYDSVTCTNCGAFKTDSQWGIARNRWFRSRADAEFYRQNGRLPEAQHGQEGRPDV